MVLENCFAFARGCDFEPVESGGTKVTWVVEGILDMSQFVRLVADVDPSARVECYPYDESFMAVSVLVAEGRDAFRLAKIR